MSYITLLVTFLPYLLKLLSFYISSGKDRDNLLDKLRQELHQNPPTPFIVESLSAKLHRWRPLAASELLYIFHRDNAWLLFRLLAPARRGIIMIKLSGSGESYRFCYSGLYAFKTARLLILIFCASLAAYFLYNAIGIETTMLMSIKNGTFAGYKSWEIVKLSVSIASCILAYCMTAFHAVSILFAALRIYALNTLLHPNLPENQFRLKKWLMSLVMLLITYRRQT